MLQQASACTSEPERSAWMRSISRIYWEKKKALKVLSLLLTVVKLSWNLLIWGRIACSILLNVKKELKCCFASILYYFFLSESSHSALCPRYVIYHVIFSFYQGTAYLANPSEIPFLISYSRVVILYNLTALDIIYFHKLQITWEKGFFFLFEDALALWRLFSFIPAFCKNHCKRYIKVAQSHCYCL